MAYTPGWHVPDFVKFNGEDNRTTWEHKSQYIAQLGEASAHDSLKVRLFSMSLTGTVFSWFSSYPLSLLILGINYNKNFMITSLVGTIH
jgi:hypothetical protein